MSSTLCPLIRATSPSRDALVGLGLRTGHLCTILIFLILPLLSFTVMTVLSMLYMPGEIMLRISSCLSL